MIHESMTGPTLQPNALTRRFAELIADRPRKILDVGCWEGRDSLYLAKQGHEVVGITHLPEEQKIATANARALGLMACRFITMDARNLSTLRSERFDAILTCNMLHEVPLEDSIAIVRTMQAITRPGGYNAISAYLASDATQNVASRQQMFHRGELMSLYASSGDWEPQEYHEDDYQACTQPSGKEYVTSHVTLIARRMLPLPEQSAVRHGMTR